MYQNLAFNISSIFLIDQKINIFLFQLLVQKYYSSYKATKRKILINMKLSEDVDLPAVAKDTHGFVGADMA